MKKKTLTEKHLENFIIRIETPLKKCPFCGGNAKIMDQKYGYYKYYPYCSKCECRLQAFPTELEAREAWNKRINN